jgi:Pyruvate/2-oxoacid:ferredoxin oxidoreductase gamma subunit
LNRNKIILNTIKMKLNIRVAGAAGLGMNSTADIIADVFALL